MDPYFPGIEAVISAIRESPGYCILIFMMVNTLGCRLAARGSDMIVTLAATKGVQLGELDAETLDRLELSIGKSGQAKPGDRLEITVGTNECCYYFQPVVVDITWSIEPADGAEIDPHSGEVMIDREAKSGASFTVTANVEKGLRILTGEIIIYRPEDNPLVGVWHEISLIACEDQSAHTGDDMVRELVFKADGKFQATFTPFEIYHDDWGSYDFDVQQGTLVLQVTGGNYIPVDLDLEGTFAINKEGNLELKDVWLGRREPGSIPACGHIFVK